jgi:hypothetical protein
MPKLLSPAAMLIAGVLLGSGIHAIHDAQAATGGMPPTTHR